VPGRGQPGFNWTSDQRMSRIPVWSINMLNPLLVGAFRWNAYVYEGFGTIASEWQNFVSSRLREDFALIQRVAHSRMPDQVWASYAEFWRKAVEDYGKEYMIIGRLVAEVSSKSLAVAQSAAEEASADASRASSIG
jgi:Phasin protein